MPDDTPRAADEPSRSHGEPRPDHVAVGYTDRAELDRFITGEAGDLLVHGPIHAGSAVADVATMGTGVTEGTPCLVVPLIRERVDTIRREALDALDRFAAGRPRPGAQARPETFGQTGGTARGTSAGAIRRGAAGPPDA